MATSFVLRDVRQGDAAAISALVTGLSERWIAPDCTPDGASILLASMGVDATEERLRGDGYRCVVAEFERGGLVGVAALVAPRTCIACSCSGTCNAEVWRDAYGIACARMRRRPDPSR